MGPGPGPRLRLKGTFIDVDAQDKQAESPRAHSEPRPPVHDRFYFEEQRRYVAELSNRDWCGSQPCHDLGRHPRFGSQRSETPQRRQPLMPRRIISHKEGLSEPPVLEGEGAATGSTDGPDERLRRLLERPERSPTSAESEDALHVGPTNSAGSSGPFLLLWDLLKPDEGTSPCPSWVGNAGSGSEWGDKVSEVDAELLSSKPDVDSQKWEERNVRRQRSPENRWCGSATTWHGADDASAEDHNAHKKVSHRGAASPGSHPGGWGLSRASTASEPGSHWRDRRQPRPCGTPRQEGTCEQKIERREKELPRPTAEQLLAGEKDAYTISDLSGKWRVAEGGGDWAGVWTIQDDGRAWFNGKRFGNDYDISIQEGGTVIQRGDGWTTQSESLGSDQLVWSKDGEAGNVTWTRKNAVDQVKTSSKSRESHTELRSKMQASARQMSDGWASTGRLSSALAVVEEIPMRISEDMQRAASYVVDNMQTEVAAVSKQIRGSDWGSSSERSERQICTTDKVIKNLEVIPTMVQNLLEARVQKARDKVRHRVHGMIQNLSVIQEENWDDREQLVSQMRMISEEVEKIAGDAVKAAAQECHAHAARQLDFALHTLRDQSDTLRTVRDGKEPTEEPPPTSNSQKWEDSQKWEVTHDPEFWPKAVADANFAKDSMEQAVAVVQDKDYIPQSITNQVVADELLRARIRSGGGCRIENTSRQQSSMGGTAKEAIANPGSRGHPDFCPRPCFYFSQGRCQNGNDCLFCHMPHPKRPVRFDKQHRDELKKMSFVELVTVVLPVLRQKGADLNFGPDVVELIATLWGELEDCSQGREVPEAGAPGAVAQGGAISSNASHTGSERSSRQPGSFSGAFQVMGFRSLLAMVAPKVPRDAPEVRDLVELVLQKARETRGALDHDGSSAVSTVSEANRGAALRGRRRGPASRNAGPKIGGPGAASSGGPAQGASVGNGQLHPM